MEKMFDSPGLLIALVCSLLIVGALVAVLSNVLYRLMDLFMAQTRSGPSESPKIKPISESLKSSESLPLPKQCCFHCGKSLDGAPIINEIALSETESYLVFRCADCGKKIAIQQGPS